MASERLTERSSAACRCTGIVLWMGIQAQGRHVELAAVRQSASREKSVKKGHGGEGQESATKNKGQSMLTDLCLFSLDLDQRRVSSRNTVRALERLPSDCARHRASDKGSVLVSVGDRQSARLPASESQQVCPSARRLRETVAMPKGAAKRKTPKSVFGMSAEDARRSMPLLWGRRTKQHRRSFSSPSPSPFRLSNRLA